VLNASEDVAAILADCGGEALTASGPLQGRLVEEPIEIETAAGLVVHSSEIVFYTAVASIEAIALVRKAWIQVDAARYFVRDIPRADAAGVVRLVLQR
jgi:hypothetical protein